MPAKVSVREATSSDLPALIELLCRRDGRHHDPEAVRDVLFDLEPNLLRAWVAWVDDNPAGLTTIYLRTLRFENGEQKAGYWAHLFVDERYRKLMILPRLILAMVRGAQSDGLDLLYTITRQSQLAQAAGKFGFELVAKQPALIHPLRPLGLVAKRLGLPLGFARVAAPADGLYGAVASRVPATDLSIDEVDPASPDCHATVEMLNEAGEGLIGQLWTSEQFRRRFKRSIDSCHYTLLVARRRAGPTAALIFRIAERGNQIRAGVIIDACWKAEEETSARSLLHCAQRRAFEAGADVMLTMDSLGAGTGTLATALGYRRSSEIHHFLVWPRQSVQPGCPAACPKRWRFAYADHDAF